MTSTLDAPSTADAPPGTDQAYDVACRWLDEFGSALQDGDLDAVDRLFLADGWWRDLLAFTWDLRTIHGTEAIKSTLGATLEATRPSDFQLTAGKPPELIEADENTRWVQGFFDFQTAVARGRGFFRLMPDGDMWKGWTVLTAMEELKGHEEPAGATRVKGVNHGENNRRTSWLDRRRAKQDFAEKEPQVLVVGAGQGGLSIAARLGQLDVDTLVIERNERIGDSWRKRYRSLVLHDPVWYDHMAYLPFPKNWPVFTPKDKLADWFESYASSMELNVWTRTQLLGATYDDATSQWTATVRREDGTERVLHPRHIVLATGMSGVPKGPEIPGTEVYAGVVTHSSGHAGGQDYAGKNAIVVGCCNSGHDIAHDFYEQGANVTMVQRSSTYVMTSENGIATLFAGTYEENGPPTEDADLIFASIPYPVLAHIHQGATQQIAELDKDLLAGLERAGFKIDYGEDGSGLFMKYLRRGGGYYIDVGASQLIADGKIKIKQGVEIERFTSTGVEFTDGTELPADIVVLATGYENMRESARALLGDAVADRCTPVWGLDDEGELRTIWRNSGHDGLWFMGGNLHQSRHYSKFLALKIKAIEEDLPTRGTN
ncbi:MAG: NAD(P)/FAD-dependent oxidoreductase [Geodermatophilaceae bacterium]|nr:NAD(P)/FAD-dependent oxidoreductase [Geodermatophilaceae bacterium]